MSGDNFYAESLLEASYNRNVMNTKNDSNLDEYGNYESNDRSYRNDSKESQSNDQQNYVNGAKQDSSKNGKSRRHSSHSDDYNEEETKPKDDDRTYRDGSASSGDRTKKSSHKRKHRERSESRHKGASHRRNSKSPPHPSHLEQRSKKSRYRSKSRSPRRSKSKSQHHRSVSKTHRNRSRSKSRRERSRSKSRRERSRSHQKRHHSPLRHSRDYHKISRRSNSRDRRRRHSLTPLNLPIRKRSTSPYPKYKKHSPPPHLREPPDDLSLEERDARTVYVMQLPQKVRAKDLEEFFSSVGKVRDVRLIMCNKTRRFKGIACIEFVETESVALALGLNGQKLLDTPIIVQPTQAEKNRIGSTVQNTMNRNHPGPTRLYVGSLHINITEDMLRAIFEPFGKIDTIKLMIDQDTGRSKGYGFVTYRNSDDAKKALEQMNGFELAGRPMKINDATERQDFAPHTGVSLDTDELDRAGIDLGATGRLQLMYKLAEGTGMELPPAAANALNLSQMAQGGAPLINAPTPPIATQCFLLSNMFDPTVESNTNWDVDIMNDVIEECSKHGGCVHVFVDKSSPQGNVYVKCPTIATATAAINSLHGRWFGGRVITAAYVPILNYHNLFPDAMVANTLLLPYKPTK